MNKIFTIFVAVLLTATVWAQSPEKMSYQAVIRNSSDALVTNTQIGMEINILQGSPTGTVVYTETQTPTTNANGLVSIEIGGGAGFNTIDWSAGPYFIETKTAVAPPLTTYTITGTSQLLSVPYALHAKTAESISGGITETDPIYGLSVASGITGTDTTNWNNKLDSETDPIFSAWDKSTGISITESQISNLDHFTNADETDPIYVSSVASGITGTDTSNWNNKLDSETDPIFSAWDKSTGISITESQISDLDHFTNADETDPSVPTGTQAGEMQYWNGTAWVTVPAGNSGEILIFINGKPTWGIQGMEDGDVYNPTTGEIWMDRNLGASQVATGSTDAASYGDLYQWGRGTDGHQIRTSGTTTTLSNSDTPGHGIFIISTSSPWDWRNPQNGSLWQGISGTNNPCPSGYRLPTDAELEAERLSWSSNNSAGAFNSPLKLPVAGFRYFIDGSLNNVGSYGVYWSSTIDGINSLGLGFGSIDSGMLSYARAVGFSVRCIKD